MRSKSIVHRYYHTVYFSITSVVSDFCTSKYCTWICSYGVGIPCIATSLLGLLIPFPLLSSVQTKHPVTPNCFQQRLASTYYVSKYSKKPCKIEKVLCSDFASCNFSNIFCLFQSFTRFLAFSATSRFHKGLTILGHHTSEDSRPSLRAQKEQL